jgi:hypothetical protein
MEINSATKDIIFATYENFHYILGLLVPGGVTRPVSIDSFGTNMAY